MGIFPVFSFSHRGGTRAAAACPPPPFPRKNSITLKIQSHTRTWKTSFSIRCSAASAARSHGSNSSLPLKSALRRSCSDNEPATISAIAFPCRPCTRSRCFSHAVLLRVPAKDDASSQMMSRPTPPSPLRSVKRAVENGKKKPKFCSCFMRKTAKKVCFLSAIVHFFGEEGDRWHMGRSGSKKLKS